MVRDVLRLQRPADWGAVWLREVAARLVETGLLTGAALARYDQWMPVTARRNDLSEATLTALISDPEVGEIWFRLLCAAPVPDRRISAWDRAFDCAAELTLTDALYRFAQSAQLPKFTYSGLSQHTDQSIREAVTANIHIPQSWR